MKRKTPRLREGAARGQFKPVEEIDAYIREPRDEWDQ